MMSCILALYIGVFGGSFGLERVTSHAQAIDRLDARPDAGVPVSGFQFPVSSFQFFATGLSDCRLATGHWQLARGEFGTQATADPDKLYAARDNLASAQAAERIWAARLAANPKDFESAWKLARARYWLGGHAAADDRKALLEGGIAAARAAVAVAPNKPEGHFWIAANMGALAESFGLRQGLKYRGEIKNEMEAVLKIDPGFQQGSADRALGRWYFKVPGMFGGDKKQSEEHLRKSLTYNPNSTASLYFLAETLIDMKRKDEARAMLEKILAVPVDPDWAPEDREFKDKAKQLIATLK